MIIMILADNKIIENTVQTRRGGLLSETCTLSMSGWGICHPSHSISLMCFLREKKKMTKGIFFSLKTQKGNLCFTEIERERERAH